MATVSLNGPSYYLAGTNVDSLNSPVVGYESTYNRVARYSFVSPASGATQVSLSFTGMTFVDGTQKPLRFYIGTSDSDHSNAGSGSTYTGEMSYSGSTWSGSASILLQPATTYYLWIFPSTTTYGYWYWNTGSASMSTNGGLKTTISAGNGTLNSSHTITLTRYSTDFKHTITATCGTSTITVATGVQANSYTWTPPLDWCYQQASSIYVDVTIYCETFSGSTSCGTSQTTVTMTMPDSVKPSVTLSVSDANSYASTYSGYVQNKSQAKVTTNTSGTYGSSISSTVITVGSASATASSGTFDLPSSGTITIKATTTDTRGRSATTSTTITVLAYSAPVVQILSQYRCDSAGTAQTDGAYVKVTWSATVTSLNSKNTASYSLKYRVRGASSWSSVSLSGSYSVSGSTKIISASIDNAYDLCVTATDKFGTVESSYRTITSAGALMTGDCASRSINFGGGDPIANTVRFLMAAKFEGGIESVYITDLNSATETGVYYWQGDASNRPFYSGQCAVARRQGGDYIFQFALSDGTYVPTYAIRKMTQGSWGEWEWVNPPMLEGVEYRTTERFNGSPVYRKLVVYTNSATFGSASGVADTGVAHGISGFSKLVSCVTTQGTEVTFPYFSAAGTSTSVGRVTASYIIIRTVAKTEAPATWYFDLKYIK